MTSVNGDVFGGSSPARATWTDFCEHHAASAAEEFAWHVGQYLQENPAYAGQDFRNKYAEYFLLHFDAQSVLKRPTANTSSITGTPFASPSKSPRKEMTKTRASVGVSQRSYTIELADGSVATDQTRKNDFEHEDQTTKQVLSPTKQHKSFFRKFSIRGIRGNMKPLRQLFKQHSDELELSNSTVSDEILTNGTEKHQSKARHEKAKMTKMLVECKKEGVVSKLVDDDSTGRAKWEKCRLMLVKTTGGDLLEIYIPPKVSWCFEKYECLLDMKIILLSDSESDIRVEFDK